ncbi:sensor histidine kinase [Streptomyces sp. ISL-66]|uniref:sensor histidine kinase n=1 Tax=Streptomyces sp. ISL-66 TaxID=2819186 RepID=UPI0020359F5A|nr:ATP-binding protein [Streptomyces sp. ISL-66]
MRRLLVLLRVGPEGRAGHTATLDEDCVGDAPAPGVDRLPELTRRVTAAGVPVTLEITGERSQLSPGMDLCVYRVVQEALTNVLKHAGPAKAVVSLAFADQAVTVRIKDDGNQPYAPEAGAPSGHGLIGMRERARIYHGTVTTGPLALGGFEVRLVLPTQAGTEHHGTGAAP